MKSQKIDRVAAALLLDSFEDAFMDWLEGVHHADVGGVRERGRRQWLGRRARRRRLPNATFAEVPGTHMSSVTKPEFGEAIARFLVRHKKGAPDGAPLDVAIGPWRVGACRFP